MRAQRMSWQADELAVSLSCASEGDDPVVLTSEVAMSKIQLNQAKVLPFDRALIEKGELVPTLQSPRFFNMFGMSPTFKAVTSC